MYLIISLFISLIYCILFQRPVMKLVEISSNTVKNYRERAVYNSAGITFILYITFLNISYFLVERILWGKSGNEIIIILLGSLSAGFTGYLDDNSYYNAKGIRGHGMLLLNGILTSGSVKALIAVTISFIISCTISTGVINILVNSLLISLMQNFINLLDLRPGRAIKVYLGLSLLCLPFLDIWSVYPASTLGMAVLLIVYLPGELSELFIMGDTGSNVLGVLIGITIASSNNIIYKLVILFIVVCAHIYAELYSLNRLIEQTPFLNFIDKVGRKGYDKD